ncbi:MAG: tetratricopeptide repeat protein [Candidatus Zixiibacteriota bacterium]
MKISAKLAIILVITIFLVGSTFAGKKDRKLTVGAYISSAKIEIVSGDLERYETAITYLDSLFLNYGPHAEGLHLMAQIMVDYIDKTPELESKKKYVEKLVAYVDSLHRCCENKEIDKKYRKGCDEYTELNDSVKVRYWQEFYNRGFEQMHRIDTLRQEMAGASDSTWAADLQKSIDVTVDSCVTNMEISIMLNPVDHRAYIAAGQANEKVGKYQEAIKWLSKGVEMVEDTASKASLLFSLAYNNIQMNDFCGAIPYFKQYTDIYTEDTLTLYNLAACYNNCGFYDSALFVNQRVIEYASCNIDALTAVGLYHNQNARNASDSANHYQTQQDEKTATLWRSKRDEAFDSSLVYFERAVNCDSTNIMSWEQYGTIVAIRGQYENAARAFKKLTELDPGRAEYWRSLGDFDLRLKKFDDAIMAYEKTVEIDPGDKETWERLKSLYHEKGQSAKEAEVDKKLKSLQ